MEIHRFPITQKTVGPSVIIVENMKYFIVIGLGIIFLYTGIAHANGFGVTLDKVVGDYTTNVDYDAIDGIYSGYPVQFAFQLFNRDRTQPVAFSDVWVTITQIGANTYTPPVFDAGIVGSSLISPGMTFMFAKSGSYDMKIRFETGDKSIAEATFSLTVTDGGKSSATGRFSSDFFRGGLSTLIIILAIEFLAWLLVKRWKKA